MVLTFQSIRAAIQQNSQASLQVASYRLKPAAIVESFKLPTMPVDVVVIPKRVAPLVAAVPLAPAAPIRLPSPTRSEEMLEPVPKPRLQQSLPQPQSQPQSQQPQSQQSQPTSSPPPSPPRADYEVPRGRPLDPLCIAIETRDPMYAIANQTTKQSIESEEARRIEGLIGKLYKEESGRSRGWVKTKLEAHFMPRAAVGSRVQSKDAFDWSKIWTDKEASALLDFICIAKGVRLAVWKDSEKVVGIWPAADSANVPNPPLFHVSAQGVYMQNRNIQQSTYALKAPYSVEHALEKLSIDELNNVAEKMGIPVPAGKKADKVAALASARMRMRIQ